MSLDANIGKVIFLLIFSVPFIAHNISTRAMPRFALPWTATVIMFCVIVAHYFSIGTSVSDDNNEILAAGAALLNLTFWIGNSLRQPKTFWRIEFSLSLVAIFFVLWNIQPGNSLNSINYIEDNYIGVTSNANILGGYLAITCAPLLLFGAMRASSLNFRFLYWGLFVGVCFLILITRSRASVLALGAGVGFLVFKDERVGRAAKLVIVGIVGLLLVYFLAEISNKYLNVGLFGTRDALVEQRLVAIAERPWLGWGLNSNVSAFYYEKSIFPPMEKGNTILQVVEDLGIPFGLLVVGSLMALAWRVANHLHERFDAIGFSIAIIVSMVHLMFETWLFNFQSVLSIYFWLVILSSSFSLSGSRAPVGQALKYR